MIAQQQLVLAQHRQHAERAAQRQRADVAHEDLGRIGVEPEEAERRADQRAQKTVSSPAPGTYGISSR